jgi:sugar phosphate isomerase/epimerase
MRFGAMNFPVSPILQEIEAFAALGFDFLELAMDPPAAHYSSVRDQHTAIRQALETHAMGLVCHLPTFVSTADLTESIRRASIEEMLRSLETAAYLGAEKVIVHPGHIRGMASFVRDKALGHAVESVDLLVDRARRIAMPLCLENMFPAYGAFCEADELSTLLERHPSMGMTLDTGHAHIDSRGGRRIDELIRRFGRRIKHVHISDNSGRSDDHLPVGGGNINFPKVVRALARSGYDGTVTLEVFTDNRNDLITSKNAVAAMFADCRST